MNFKINVCATCACLLLIISTQTYASVVYTYTGNPYQSYLEPTSPFDNTMSITGTFELSTSLAKNLMFLEETLPTSFSFSNGVSTISNENATISSFYFSTDSNGVITGWDIALVDRETFTNIGDIENIITTGASSLFIDDGTRMATCTSSIDCTIDSLQYVAQSNGDAGTWAVSTVPIPASIWLFASGLLGLIGTIRNKK